MDLIDINLLQVIVESSLHHFEYTQPDIHAITLIQANTGLRIGEVLQIDRWGEFDQDTMVVHCEKSDQVRLILKSDIPNILLISYLSQSPLFNRSYSSYNHQLKQVLPIVMVHDGCNRVLSHIYRYYFTRQLFISGFTDLQIQSLMAHENLVSTQRYLNMPLYLLN